MAQSINQEIQNKINLSHLLNYLVLFQRIKRAAFDSLLRIVLKQYLLKLEVSNSLLGTAWAMLISGYHFCRTSTSVTAQLSFSEGNKC